MTSQSLKKQLSLSISRIVPNIISGAHLAFMSKEAVTHCQIHVLMVLYSLGPIPMNLLAKKLHIQMPTATGIIDRMEKCGMARRSRAEKDRRRVMVHLTSQGEQFIHRFQRSISSRWEEVLGYLDTKDLENYLAITTKIERAFARQKTTS